MYFLIVHLFPSSTHVAEKEQKNNKVSYRLLFIQLVYARKSRLSLSKLHCAMVVVAWNGMG